MTTLWHTEAAVIAPYKFGFVLSVLISVFDSVITFSIELAGRVCQSSLTSCAGIIPALCCCSSVFALRWFGSGYVDALTMHSKK